MRSFCADETVCQPQNFDKSHSARRRLPDGGGAVQNEVEVADTPLPVVV